MGPHSNLQPGTSAPQSGLYVCGHCAPGGLLETLTGGVAGLRGDATAFSSAGEVSAHFEAGATLPRCERCGIAAGWDLVQGTIEDYRREKAGSQRAVFDSLGINTDKTSTPDRRPTAPTKPDYARAKEWTIRWIIIGCAFAVVFAVFLYLFYPSLP